MLDRVEVRRQIALYDPVIGVIAYRARRYTLNRVHRAAMTISAPDMAVTAWLQQVSSLISEEVHFQNYHRVLNRARWSTLEAAQILLRMLVRS
jgi:hypothetical protein